MNNVTIKKASLLFTFIGLAGVLAYTFLPSPMQYASISFIPISTDDESEMPIDLPPHLYQEHLLTLVYPEFLWLGDSQYLILTLQPEAGDQVEKTSPLSNYSTSLEARLDLPSMQISPGNAMYQVFQNGKQAQFLWDIKAENHESAGKLWLYLIINQYEEGLEQTIPLFALPIEISIKSWLGWTLPILRGLIIVGLVCLIFLWIIFITPKFQK